MWVVIAVLASCQGPAGKPAKTGTITATEGYPSLHTVPPRPQLSYSVEQRRAIVDGLVADRENARYTGEVVRYRAGLSNTPPPEPPIVAAVEAGPEAADAASAPSGPPGDRPAVPESPELFYEDDDLGSFMRDLLRDGGAPGAAPEARAAPPGTVTSQSGPADERIVADDVRPSGGAQAVAVTMAAGGPAPARAAPATARADASAGIAPPPSVPAKPAPAAELATARTPEPPELVLPRPVEKPAPGVAQIEVADGLVAVEIPAGHDRGAALGAVAFGPGSAALSPDARARLEQILGEANARGARVRIVGEGAAPALALDRARAVGLALVQGGLPPERLEMTLAYDAAGDRARLFLASP
jgi:outer membrane protein OmpA-like peptidoglycan-associated protein